MPPASPTPRAWAYLCAGIATEVTGSLSLRGALDRHWLYGVVVLGFLAATVCLSRSLRHGMNVGVAYGIWGACGVALTAVFSAILFQEALTPLVIIGIVVVIAGVLCIELGSQAAAAAGPGGRGGAHQDAVAPGGGAPRGVAATGGERRR